MALEGLQLGPYRLLRLLGSGGMGEVYLAEDARIGQQVAIKVNRTDVASYPTSDIVKDAVRLFQREAKAIARLDHPHILPLYTYGEEQVNGMTLIYIVMPYRREGSFVDWLQGRSSTTLLPAQDVAYFISQAADALQYAHDNQIVHQDVKPSNFLLRTNKAHPNRPDLLLADFGIARFSGATSSASQSIRGTPAFMAPEQWSGEPVYATDQYALAVFAYELLAGRPPFAGRQEQVMYQHFHVQPQPPSSFNPLLSRDVDAVILRALAKKPEERFPSISIFAQALQQAIAGNDASTLLHTPSLSSGDDLRITLAISKDEARKGTRRTLNLPGGQQVIVSVPPGAYDGQVLRHEITGGSSTGSLVITLSVQEQAEARPASPGIDLDKTLPNSDPKVFISPQSPSHPDNRYVWTPVSPPPLISNVRGVHQPVSRRQVLSATNFLVVLTVLVVAIGGGLLYFQNFGHPTSSNPNTSSADVVATTRANDATSFAATATAHTISANPTATSQATSNSPTPPNNATATATAPTTQSFPPPNANLVLDDPLSDNSQGHGWETKPDSGGVCEFTGGAYQVTERQQPYYEYCPAYNTSFSQFAYEVQMTFIQGDLAGLLFRDDTNQITYYYRFNSSGQYDLVYYDNTSSKAQGPLASGQATSFNAGLNQTNTLNVVVSGNSITLYVNRQYVTSATTVTTYGQGYIGVFVRDQGNLSQASFNNAKVWTF